MSDSQLSRIDLNLIVVLDALLIERSVTRAAARLYLSQPAVSGSLAKLRAHFDDPILERNGNVYELTPLAQRLSTLTGSAIDVANAVFGAGEVWRPAVSEKEFTLYGSDHTFAVVAPELLRRAKAEAPSVRFRFLRYSNTMLTSPSSALRNVDGLIIPHGFIGDSDDLQYMDLWQDQWAMLISDSNTVIEERVEPRHVFELPWATTPLTRRAIPTSFLHRERVGFYPHVHVTVESALALPFVVAGTDRIALIQRSLSAFVATVPGVRLVDPPFAPTPTTNAIWWHEAQSDRADHRWLRELCDAVGRSLEE